MKQAPLVDGGVGEIHDSVFRKRRQVLLGAEEPEWLDPNSLFSRRTGHTRLQGDWSSDVCSSDLMLARLHEDSQKEHREACHHSMPSIQADRKSTRLNSSHLVISYAVFCL